MPGGGMEWGESPIETAVREVEEETGFTATIGPVLGVFSRWYTDRESVRGEAGHLVGIVYGATDVTGELRTTFDDRDHGRGGLVRDGRDPDLPRVELIDFVLTIV